MKLTDKQVKEWTSFFIRENRLPSSKIPCNKCEGSATLVHGNLLKRVIKFKGVENLLKSFECRKCHNATKKQTKEIKRKIKKEKKQKKEEILTKSFIFIPKGPEIVILKDNPEYVAELTATECWRPDLYLDNDRTCNACELVKHCTCPIKTLKEGKRKEGTSVQRRK